MKRWSTWSRVARGAHRLQLRGWRREYNSFVVKAPKFWKSNIYSQSLVFWAKVCKRDARVLIDSLDMSLNRVSNRSAAGVTPVHTESF